MKPVIVLIPVELYSNGRDIADFIRGKKFNKDSNVRITCGNMGKDTDIGDVVLYDLSEFIDECNDERIDLTDFWLSYVYITNK